MGGIEGKFWYTEYNAQESKMYSGIFLSPSINASRHILSIIFVDSSTLPPKIPPNNRPLHSIRCKVLNQPMLAAHLPIAVRMRLSRIKIYLPLKERS